MTTKKKLKLEKTHNANSLKALDNLFGDMDALPPVAPPVATLVEVKPPREQSAREKPVQIPETKAKAKTLVLSPYATNLLNVAIDKVIDFATNPSPNLTFINKNANRDHMIAKALEDNDCSPKRAAKVLSDRMRARGLPRMSVLNTIEAMGYLIMKQCMFPAFIDQQQVMSRMSGKLNDDVYASMLDTKQNGGSFEDTEHHEDAARRSKLLADEREEEITAPLGIDIEHITLFSGYMARIDGDVAYHPSNLVDGTTGHASFTTGEICEALDDIRVTLETLIASYGKPQNRLPFFIENVGGTFVRHEGTVYDALLAFGLQQNEKQAIRRAATDSFFAREARELETAAAA